MAPAGPLLALAMCGTSVSIFVGVAMMMMCGLECFADSRKYHVVPKCVWSPYGFCLCLLQVCFVHACKVPAVVAPLCSAISDAIISCKTVGSYEITIDLFDNSFVHLGADAENVKQTRLRTSACARQGTPCPKQEVHSQSPL